MSSYALYERYYAERAVRGTDGAVTHPFSPAQKSAGKRRETDVNLNRLCLPILILFLLLVIWRESWSLSSGNNSAPGASAG